MKVPETLEERLRKDLDREYAENARLQRRLELADRLVEVILDELATADEKGWPEISPPIKRAFDAYVEATQ